MRPRPRRRARRGTSTGSSCAATSDGLLVTGRVVTEEPDFDLLATTPNHDLSQHELPNLGVTLKLSDAAGRKIGDFPTKADDEGWVSTRLALGARGLAPGAYRLDVWSAEYWLASVGVRLLAPDHAGAIVISDIDLTYLDTDFQSADAILELLDQTASERVPLPAMAIGRSSTCPVVRSSSAECCRDAWISTRSRTTASC